MSHVTFTEKPLPAVLLAQFTEEVGGIDEIGGGVGPMFGRLMSALGEVGVPFDAPAVAWWPTCSRSRPAWYEARRDRTALAAALPITEAARAKAESVNGIVVEEIPPVDRAVTVVHLGARDSISQTWQALAREVHIRGLRPVGRCREVYLEAPQDNPDSWVTEFQQPVE
jgi:hypothetical protein